MDGSTALLAAILVALVGLIIALITHWRHVTQALNSNMKRDGIDRLRDDMVKRDELRTLACQAGLKRLDKDMIRLAFKEDVVRVQDNLTTLQNDLTITVDKAVAQSTTEITEEFSK